MVKNAQMSIFCVSCHFWLAEIENLSINVQNQFGLTKHSIWCLFVIGVEMIEVIWQKLQISWTRKMRNSFKRAWIKIQIVFLCWNKIYLGPLQIKKDRFIYPLLVSLNCQSQWFWHLSFSTLSTFTSIVLV